MAERKADADTPGATPGRAPTSEEREHAAAARAVGQQLGPRQLGGTVIEADGRVTYTRDGAVSALPGGHPDPTIIPGQFPEDEAQRELHVVDRADAAPLTGDAPPAEKK
jgi:hypothetical protein